MGLKIKREIFMKIEDELLKWLECVEDGWRIPKEVMPEVIKLINRHKCVDCGKDLTRCENCERLWQT